MSAEALALRGQAAAERLMVDTCSITRTTNESTSGGVVTPTTITVYAGKCRIQSPGAAGRGQTVGEAYQIVGQRELQLPMSAPIPAEGDQVAITAAAVDAALVGKTYAVQADVTKTHATRRRITVIEVSS